MIKTHETAVGSARKNKEASPYLSSRCSKRMKKRVRDAKRSTGLEESDFLLTAVTEFFEKHKTPGEQIAAVSRYRVAALK